MCLVVVLFVFKTFYGVGKLLMGCLWHLDLGDAMLCMQFIYLEAYGRQR
jgi:hypothetical protein